MRPPTIWTRWTTALFAVTTLAAWRYHDPHERRNQSCDWDTSRGRPMSIGYALFVCGLAIGVAVERWSD